MYPDEKVNQYISWGAGPRASQYLVLASKCHAAINGKFSPDIEDVKAVAVPILRHRIVKNYKAEAEGFTVESIIKELFVMILPIVAYGTVVLKQKAKEIAEDYEGLQQLIDNMFETMNAANGVGLAAPQIGKSIRLFIVDASPFEEESLD